MTGRVGPRSGPFREPEIEAKKDVDGSIAHLLETPALLAGAGMVIRNGAANAVCIWAIPWMIAAVATRRFRWSHDSRLNLALRLQTATVCVIACCQISGLLGLMHWVLPWAPPLLYAAVTTFCALVRQPVGRSVDAIYRSEGILAGFTMAIVAILFGRFFPTSLLGAVKVISDAPIYHLFFAAKWWVAGAITWVPIPFGESGAPYFPANGDLWFTYLVGWTGDLTLAKVGQVPFWFYAGFLIVCLCRTLGASAGAGRVSAAIWMTLTPLALFTFEANVDTIFAAWFVASVYFYVEFDKRKANDGPETGAEPDLSRTLMLQSLIAAGLAWGTKAPGLVFLPPWILFMTLREAIFRPERTFFSTFAVFVSRWAVAISPVIYWWVRNIVATGNPLYPLPIEIGGFVIGDGWYGPDVMRMSPYFIPFSEWTAALDQLLAVSDPRVLPLVLLAFVWWGKRFFVTKTLDERWVRILAAFGVLTIGLYWGLIPYRTQQRFFLHGLALFAPLIALAMDRFRVFKILCVISLCLHVFTIQGWPATLTINGPSWDLSPLIPNFILGLVPLPDLLGRLLIGDIKTISVLVMTLGLALFQVFRFRSRRWLTGIATALTFVGFMGILAGEQRSFDQSGRGQKFPLFPDYERAWNAFDSITKSGPMRVAYTGTNLAIYLMGPKLANSVEYVNVNENASFMPHDYHLAMPAVQRRWDDPRPTWERMDVSYDAWLHNLDERRIELVVVARANPDEGRANPFDEQGFPIERAWMDAHPQRFRPVYGHRENDPEMRIYEVVR